VAYLQERRKLSRSRGPVFVSESRRNRGEPISIWTWSKVVEGIAERSGVQQFTTHTLRHLRLTDLARCGWDIHEIALFAGHRDTNTTLQYIHLSGCDLKAKVERSMANIHAWRVRMIAEVFQ
jgi:integrase/recombinase XerD